jgi:hypothetical protein
MRLEIKIGSIITHYHVVPSEESRYARHLWRTLPGDTPISVFEDNGEFLETLRLDELFTKPETI